MVYDASLMALGTWLLERYVITSSWPGVKHGWDGSAVRLFYLSFIRPMHYPSMCRSEEFEYDAYDTRI